MTVDAKPARRIVDRAAQPIDGSPLESGRCPLCGGSMFIRSRAHVVPKGQRGDDVPENLVWICGDGTRGCHGVLTHRNRGDHGYDFVFVGRSLVCYLDSLPIVRAYADEKTYPAWVEDYYGSVPQALEANREAA